MPPHTGLYPVRDDQLGDPFTTAGRSGRHGPGRIRRTDVEAAEYLARPYRIVDRHDEPVGDILSQVRTGLDVE